MAGRFIKKINGNGVFQQTHNGFTLVEILIAIFILGLVMATVYVSYSGILKTAHQMEEERVIYKMARTSMDRMITDLSSLQPSIGAFDLRAEKIKFNNREFHTITFWSASHLAFDENEEEGCPAAIGYYVREDEDGKSFSLWRADVFASKPDKTKIANGGFIICKNVDTFKLTFYDSEGIETDVWDSSSTEGNQNGRVPAAVKIELFLVNLNDQEKPYKFMTKIFLPAKK
ncbi:MAG TPA: type II secretion system protein [Smithella sp.]|nr:type II secretion system protein [Smithella sp.]